MGARGSGGRRLNTGPKPRVGPDTTLADLALRRLKERHTQTLVVDTDDPISWISSALDTWLWPRQAEIAKAVFEHARVAVRSGHKVGKSTLAAAIAHWWAATQPSGRVVITAPTNHQIRNVVWREVRRLAFQAKVAIPQPALVPAIGLEYPDGRQIMGFATTEAERMAGISGADLLFIVDEASGVPARIFEAIEGNRAGGAHLLMLGNPTQPSGVFYDAFHDSKDVFKTFHVSSTEASKYADRIPGLATDSWCTEKLREWGPLDPRYQVRVLGEFADAAENAVVPLSIYELACERWEEMTTSAARLELGVDVARFGDDETVVVARRGRKILEVRARSNLEISQTADLVLETIGRLRVGGEQKPLVKVDSCGLGEGVVSVLRALYSDKVDCYGVNGSDPAVLDDYTNMRSQLWFGLAEWLRDGGAVPSDRRMEDDTLSARYEFDAKGRRKIEDKKTIKSRLGRSPDRADALTLAVYAPRAPLAVSRSLAHSLSHYRLGASRGF